MPDMHSGYGFSIGGVAAFDTCDPRCIISPGGVGYDINCGVRCMTTGLTRDEVLPHIKELINTLYKYIPVGVGGKRKNFMTKRDVCDVMVKGAKWAVEKGYGVCADLENCEEGGCVSHSNPDFISTRAIDRGNGQLGTLGAGNHYVEVQYVDEIFEQKAADIMGLKLGDVVIMIHTGSRGFGYQIADDFIHEMTQKCHNPDLPDPQLSSATLSSELGQRYLYSMGAAANFAWCNRQIIMHFARVAIREVFDRDDLGLDLIYDVAHNIAKLERHTIDGVEREFVVHRKGATRAFGPGHPDIPERYREIGQPVLIGGSMGTASYILCGNDDTRNKAFGSTCHGAGRVMSRNKAIRELKVGEIKDMLAGKGIELRAADKKTIVEEAPGTYKDVERVVAACESVGVSRRICRLVPLGVIKG
jgi:tRNA-splicing ligase RtcB